ncbi:group III truncated hemoglobin [Cucumibacter marinus]|uniref:group III truncated hemoglobin n=1 Tax=Cucumibacter marinus TaxID=1121252 RepID=UPI00040D6B85|nr:group III truncated hemoglobin [Cucumibacter marinus]
MLSDRHHPALDEALIDRLVRRFYARVREDADLGPIFARAIGDDWEPHLLTMVDFWSSITLSTGRYKGRPMPAHFKHRDVIRPEHFAIWLRLFETTAHEVCPPDVAEGFVEKAQRIARSLMAGLFYDPAQDRAEAAGITPAMRRVTRPGR